MCHKAGKLFIILGDQDLRAIAVTQTLGAKGVVGAPTGLGLMLADMVARAHGGALHLPAAERGCRVEMQLPLPV